MGVSFYGNCNWSHIGWKPNLWAIKLFQFLVGNQPIELISIPASVCNLNTLLPVIDEAAVFFRNNNYHTKGLNNRFRISDLNSRQMNNALSVMRLKIWHINIWVFSDKKISVPKYGSILEHFVLNIFQNEKQFTDLWKYLIAKNSIVIGIYNWYNLNETERKRFMEIETGYLDVLISKHVRFS